MLWVFLPYAALVLLNLALRLIPSTDIRSATSVLMLGPLTAMRSVVMIAGVLFGISASELPETRFLGVFILGLMLALEFALNRRAARAQAIEIHRLI
jgi:hydrogenase/urease accessory protein HupE